MSKTIGTVCFVIEDRKVLLAEIEYPDGRRLWNGVGGVVDKEETPEHGVIREISEETRLVVDEADVEEKDVIFLGSLELHVFITEKWSGKLESIDPSIKRLQWFDFKSVPYSQMHAGNDEWLPGILQAFNR